MIITLTEELYLAELLKERWNKCDKSSPEVDLLISLLNKFKKEQIKIRKLSNKAI